MNTPFQHVISRLIKFRIKMPSQEEGTLTVASALDYGAGLGC